MMDIFIILIIVYVLGIPIIAFIYSHFEIYNDKRDTGLFAFIWPFFVIGVVIGYLLIYLPIKFSEKLKERKHERRN